MVHNFFKQKNIMKFLFLSSALLSSAFAFSSSEQSGDIKTCDDMKDLFERAKTEDVRVSMHPFQDITCQNFTTFTLDSGHDIEIYSSEDLSIFSGDTSMRKVRFEVLGGSKLTIEVNMGFSLDLDEDDYPDLEGGILFVGEESNVVFLNDLSTRDIGVRSQTVEDSDFSDHVNRGGCMLVNGRLRVDGETKLVRCESSGGGESGPGDGGAVYVGEMGSVNFNGKLEISDVSITDDDGGSGGGIYNLGKVNVKSDTVLKDLRSEIGGAIFNGKDATFTFRNGASVLISGSRAQDGSGGAIYNAGSLKFTGPTLFVESSSEYRGGGVLITETGDVKFSKETVFFGTESRDSSQAPIFVESGGVVKYSKTPLFLANVMQQYGDELSLCSGIFFEEDGCKI